MALPPLTREEAFRARGKRDYPEDTTAGLSSIVVCRCGHPVSFHAYNRATRMNEGKCESNTKRNGACSCVSFAKRIGIDTLPSNPQYALMRDDFALSKLHSPTKLCLQSWRTDDKCSEILHEHYCELDYVTHESNIYHRCGCGAIKRGRFRGWEHFERLRRD